MPETAVAEPVQTLARVEPQAPLTPIVITDEHIEVFRKTIGAELSLAEMDLFFFECRRRGVHPLDKLIYPVKIEGRLVTITSIDYMRARAASTREHAGTDEPEYEGALQVQNISEEVPRLSRVHVYRWVKGEKARFTGVARWSEFYPGDSARGRNWRKMPFGQLGKCAEAQALRKGFPQELDKLYIAEELDQAVEGEVVREEKPPKREPVRRSEKERQARARQPDEVSSQGHPPGSSSAAGAGAPSANSEKAPTPQHFLNARVLATQWVTKKDEDPFAEISIGIVEGQRIANTHVMLTRDQDVYKLAISLEGTETLLKVTFHLSKRRDGAACKILDALEAMS